LTSPPTYDRPGVRARAASWLSARARRKRLDLFIEQMQPKAGDRILDVGCGSAGWLNDLSADIEVIGIDRETSLPGYDGPNRAYRQGDALDLPFADREFDIAFSNSVIEHLDPSEWGRFASEIQRVSKRFFVQTPNKWFPVEPHVLLPGYQFLPRATQRRVWPLAVRNEPYDEITLLTSNDLSSLFPGAEILRERVGPWTKSLIAIGQAGRDSVQNAEVS
jgi:SAM-dependent methyltransferase